MRSTRMVATIAMAAITAATAAACSSSSSSTPGGSTGTSAAGKVTLTWWTNATTDPLRSTWAQIASSYHAAHPNVTINIVPVQNEQFLTKVPLALESSNPPSLYQQWGGGQEATQIKSGKLVNLTGSVSSWISELGTTAAGWQVNGQQYGIPYDLHVVGFWYRKDLFAKAGITAPPATISDLNADVVKLKAHNIAPVAIGSKDRWPDAFYWEYFALRECPTSVLKQSISAIRLNNPCFTKATNDLAAFMKTNPFQAGFLGTPAQLGAGSSAGMVANGKAAMELQGDWELATVPALTTDKKILPKLGWFPFPTISGGAGDPNTVLGGGDGFSCTTGAPEPACTDFLKYVASTPVEEKLVSQGNVGLPANSSALAVVTNPALQQVAQASKSAGYIQTYFDIAFPTTVGQALNNAVANYFAGQGGAQSITGSASGAGA